MQPRDAMETAATEQPPSAVAPPPPQMHVTVARFEPYADVAGNSWAVGFLVACLSNGRSRYFDTVVERGAEDDDDMVVQEAWNVLLSDAEAWYEGVAHKPRIMGTTFTV